MKSYRCQRHNKNNCRSKAVFTSSFQVSTIHAYRQSSEYRDVLDEYTMLSLLLIQKLLLSHVNNEYVQMKNSH